MGENEGVKVTLADGSTADADVLVGSDGIWSAVRAQMYGEEIKKSSSNLKKRQGCTYSGYTVFAGETVLKTPDYYETGYKVCGVAGSDDAKGVELALYTRAVGLGQLLITTVPLSLYYFCRSTLDLSVTL